MLYIMKTYNFFGVLGGHSSLEVAIEDHGSLEVNHIIFLCSFYYLIASLWKMPDAQGGFVY